MATTLVQAWQQMRATSVAARAAAQTALTTAQASVAASTTSLETKTTALQALSTAIATNRRALAESGVPANVAALVAAIRDQIIAQRALQGTILDARDALADAQAEADGAAAALARADARLAAASAGLAEATTAAAQRASLRGRLATPPLDTLAADIAVFVAGPVATDAQAEIDASFPAELQAIADRRFDNWKGRTATLVAARDAAEVAIGGAAAAFAHADARLRDFVGNAMSRHDRSVGVMRDLQARRLGASPHLLSTSERTLMVADAARTAAGTEAEDVAAKRDDVAAAQQAYDAQVLAQIAADVDALATDATLAGKRTALRDAVDAVAAARAALRASGDGAVMDAWQVVVQDPAWSTLAEFIDAQETLADLQSVVYGGAPTALLDALDAAEDAYALVLLDAAKRQRAQDALADTLAYRAARADAALNTLPARATSAVRGDSD